MHCTSCGYNNISQARFCQECGAELQATTQEEGFKQGVAAGIVPKATIVKKTRPRATKATIPGIQYADFWRRILATVIDGLLIIIVPFPVVIVTSWIGRSLAEVEDWGLITGFWAGWIFVLVLAWIYYAVMESSSQQATLGKMALGIIVTDQQKRRMSFGRASIRYIGKIISTVTLGIGFIMIAFTRKKQGLHDMMAGSFVLEKR